MGCRRLLSFFGRHDLRRAGAMKPQAGASNVYIRDGYGALPAFLMPGHGSDCPNPRPLPARNRFCSSSGDVSGYEFLSWNIVSSPSAMSYGQLLAIVAAIRFQRLITSASSGGDFQRCSHC